MKERPILFSAPMVRAILDGRKTQTRRIVKPQFEGDHAPYATEDMQGLPAWCDGYGNFARCPYGEPGERLWVRETHAIFDAYGQQREDGKRWGPWGGLPTATSPDGTQIAYYREGFDRCDPGRWRPSIHMPRWASRITLEVTQVRVERLQAISEEDAEAEGIEDHPDLPASHFRDYVTGGMTRDAIYSFSTLWQSINGAGSWDSNPWVWVVRFRRLLAEPQFQHAPGAKTPESLAISPVGD